MEKQISKQITNILNRYAQVSEHGKDKPKVLQNVDVPNLEKAISKYVINLISNNYIHINHIVC